MNEKGYKKRLEFQQSIISNKSKRIEELEAEVERLKLECQMKDEVINSVAPLKEELANEVAKIKQYKKQYQKLIDELKKMKKIINQTAYKGRWWLIKLFLK